METRTVAVTAQDDKDLQAAQAAASELVEAARSWSSKTLETVKAPLALVVEITEVPSRAARLAEELGRLTPDRETTKAREDKDLQDAVDILIKALQALRPALDRIGAPQAEAVAVAIGWLLSLQDLVDRVEEAREEATKAVPGGGVHAHMLDFESPDGDHVHLLRLPSGELVLTGRDGAHLHHMDHIMSGVPGGAHSHTFQLPGGRELEVASSGPHLHELEGEEATTHGGVHVHEVELDGERLSTLLPETAVDKRAMWSSPGGKATMAKRLAAVIPQGKTYVEPFAGSGAVLFEREPVEREVLADLNPDNVEAFQLVQKLTEAELDELEAMLWKADRPTFQDLKASSPDRGTMAWLRRFLYLRVFSVGGQGKSYSGDLPRTTQNSRIAKTIRRLQPRIKDVEFRVADYRDTIKAEDGPDTVFFLDPPYRGYSNMGLMESDFDEVEFRKVLDSIQGQWVLTYGAKGELDLDGFQVHRVNVQNNTSLGGKKGGRRGQFLETIVASNVELDWTGVADSYTEKVAKAAERPEEAVLPVLKSDRPDEERYILGVVLEPNDGGTGVPLDPDTQGDIYSASEIRQAAHLFMENYRNLGQQHREIVTGHKLRILESYVSLVDMVVFLDGQAVGVPSLLEALKAGDIQLPEEAQVIWRGTWLLGMRVVDDELWSDFKDGRVTGLSIGGSARRVREDTA